MLKEEIFQKYRKDYKKYYQIPEEQEKIQGEIEKLKTQKEQDRQEAEKVYVAYKSQLQQQYEQYIGNAQNQAYITQEYVRRYPEVKQQEDDFHREMEEYRRKCDERQQNQSNNFHRKREEIEGLCLAVEEEITSLEQELPNIQVPDVFDQELFRKKRQSEWEQMSKVELMPTDVDLSRDYKVQVKREVAMVMQRPVVQSVFSGLQQGVYPGKISDAMKKPFQSELFADVTRKGLEALVSKVEVAPRKPECKGNEAIRREDIEISLPVPLGIGILLEWGIPILLGILAFFFLKRVRLYVFSYTILKFLFAIIITLIGLGIGALFKGKPLAIAIGGVAGLLLSKSLSIVLAKYMHKGMAVGIKIVLALLVFVIVRILFSRFIAKPLGHGITCILKKGEEEELRDLEYRRLLQEQRCLIQEYQAQMQQYEDKMLQLVDLEEFYYNLAHYEKIVTLVLEKERQLEEEAEKVRREEINKERILQKQQQEKKFVEETEVLVQKYSTENADTRDRIQKEIEAKKQQIKEGREKREELLGKLEQHSEEQKRLCDSLLETEKTEKEEYIRKEKELTAKVASCKQEIIEDERELAKKAEQKIAEAKEKQQLKLQEIEQKCNTGISEKEAEIEELGKLQEKLAHEMWENLNKCSAVVELEDTEGALSDYLYLYDIEELGDGRTESPIHVYEIKHCKKPIVFLYRNADSGAVAKSLHKFLRMIIYSMLTIDSIELYESIISDPVAQGAEFGVEEKEEGVIRREHNIRNLFDEINALRHEVGTKKEHNIDDYNQAKYQMGEISNILKYKVVHFLVPEVDAATNTDFFSTELWGTLQSSAENGFLPIFYMKEEDWNAAMIDESKTNGKFVRKLVTTGMGGEVKNVYVVDVEKLSITSYEGR